MTVSPTEKVDGHRNGRVNGSCSYNGERGRDIRTFDVPLDDLDLCNTLTNVREDEGGGAVGVGSIGAGRHQVGAAEAVGAAA